MNRKLKITLEILENVSIKYPKTKNYVQDNMNDVRKTKHTTVEEVIYFVVFV